MKLLIITHVPHIKVNHEYFGYAPYVREMNIWLRYVDEVVVVAPLVQESLTPIHESYVTNSPFRFVKVPEFDLTSFFNQLKAFPRALVAMVKIYQAMQQADHIHLRCPGNMGLLGALVQILFPKKKKTAKYAGNWDPKSKQPWSYRLQQLILSNPFLTKNMQVLVYGEWPNQTKNVKPFFTATYSEDEIQNSEFRIQNQLSLAAKSRTNENSFDSARLDKIEINLPSTSFLFVGTLSKGKQPLYAIQLVEALHQQGEKVQLEVYGEGEMRQELERYLAQNHLEAIVTLHGNQSKETILHAYQSSHFLILPSKSEGWPKVVAEAMFWGCVPIASPVSCVAYMMGNGSRGLLLTERLEADVNKIYKLVSDKEQYQRMAIEGLNWSRQFTTDKFELEIMKLLRG
ncbi:glycosyltransferase [Flavobacterium sp. HXWNR69]|uniref:Glycosyltransferase n=1 Tax=Flavobacterium fragile TaxID=2949085 RepID=A0ABT0TFK5_9FLAO|nr:glycosyltransferase [Flavobacterium sp. HXWNR69]MCL9769754.1 glycosyltransferase [Flavobacterium sp. HXWNR69]